jgi:peroxiredoxin
MPGAFTTTCTSEHLPGYRDSIKDFYELGYDTIAIVTTNDRWVNEEWMVTVMGNGKQQGGAKGASSTSPSEGDSDSCQPRLVLLSDADGDFVKAMGLADDMGFGVGVRSRRFAMAVEDGIVTHLMTDEGMDDCSSTSAKVLLKAITPKDVAVVGDGDSLFGGGAVAAIGGILALVAAVYMGGSSMFQGADTATRPMSSSSSSSSSTTTTKVQKALPASSTKDSSQFSLLQNYKP